MVSKQVAVIVRTKARPGIEERLMEAIQEVVEPARSEEGCINLQLLV